MSGTREMPATVARAGCYGKVAYQDREGEAIALVVRFGGVDRCYAIPLEDAEHLVCSLRHALHQPAPVLGGRNHGQ